MMVTGAAGISASPFTSRAGASRPGMEPRAGQRR
jgi:hypothetical protein